METLIEYLYPSLASFQHFNMLIDFANLSTYVYALLSLYYLDQLHYRCITSAIRILMKWVFTITCNVLSRRKSWSNRTWEGTRLNTSSTLQRKESHLFKLYELGYIFMYSCCPIQEPRPPICSHSGRPRGSGLRSPHLSYSSWSRRLRRTTTWSVRRERNWQPA